MLQLPAFVMYKLLSIFCVSVTVNASKLWISQSQNSNSVDPNIRKVSIEYRVP
jgi:hypothetical protein